MRINKSLLGFIYRFGIVHVVTYALFGIFFMLISNYFNYFEDDALLSLVMKPAESLSVRLAIPIQIIRGSLLALAIYPFRTVILHKPYGWIKLFFLLFILTSVCSVITGPGSIEGMIYTNFSFDPFIGLPEIIIQMAVFSYIFCLWQGRAKIS